MLTKLVVRNESVSETPSIYQAAFEHEHRFAEHEHEHEVIPEQTKQGMMMAIHGSRLCQCEGWWEQEGLGRQPMEQLQLSFEQQRLQGTGTDVIGAFLLMGVLADNGAVAITKQYIQQHNVEYLGLYDGEGVMSGEWSIGQLRGRWMIAIRRFQAVQHGEIEEFVPSS
jgi:hypothetical protein